MNSVVHAAPSVPSTGLAVARGMGIALTVLAALGAGLWFWLGSQSSVSSIQSGATTVQGQSEAAASPSADDAHATARGQIAADRVARPAGDNAIETYLGILRLDPNDQRARQAVTELLPFASRLADQSAAQGDRAEVERLLGLIAAVDPAYAQLDALRAELAQLDVAQAAADSQPEALEQAPVRTAADRVPESAPALNPIVPPSPPPALPAVQDSEPARTLSSETVVAAVKPAEPARPEPTPAAAAAAPAAAPAASLVSEAELINAVAVTYPPQARARRLSGWVDVTLVVDERGMPRDIAVAAAEPANVFNREALRAAARWRFKPRSIDGVPTEARLKRRINFRLPG